MSATASVMAVSPSDAWALSALALAGASLLVGGARRLVGGRSPGAGASPGWPGAAAWVAGLALISALWPALGFGAQGLTWAGWLRGIVGDLGAFTVVLLVAWAVSAPSRQRPPPRTDAEGQVLRLGVAVLGWSLWLSHLLSDRVDFYSAGYGGPVLPLAVVTVAAAALLGAWRLAIGLSAALAAWGLGLMESGNLWDAVLDPWLVLWATGAGIRLAWRAVVSRARARQGANGRGSVKGLAPRPTGPDS